MKTLGMFGITEDDAERMALSEPGVTEYLNPDATREFLLSHKCFDVVIDERKWGCGSINVTEVYVNYKGEKLKLGTCDLLHQVHSSIGFTTEKEFYDNPLKFYAEKIIYGAVIMANWFYVIDSTTDG
jgi:hypothetical protein